MSRRARDLGHQTTPYSSAGENTHRDAEIPPTSMRGLKGVPGRLVAPNDRPGYKVKRAGSALRPHSGTHGTEGGHP